MLAVSREGSRRSDAGYHLCSEGSGLLGKLVLLYKSNNSVQVFYAQLICVGGDDSNLATLSRLANLNASIF